MIQFLHPGGEYKRSARHADWTTEEQSHSRKFMAAAAKLLIDGREVLDQVVFWGEWEAQANQVAAYEPSLPGMPMRVWQPYYSLESSPPNRLNTDPLVFGGFRYTICQQLRWYGSDLRPTRLRDLDPGSVILFGSKLLDEFVLDTVFVVGSSELHDRATYQRLDVPDWYREVTLDTLYPKGGASPAAQYRLYNGATFDTPVEGMYSFVPCMTLDSCRVTGFRRPALHHPLIHGAQGQSFGVRVIGDEVAIKDLWRAVIDQITEAGLMVSTWLESPSHNR